MLKWEERDIDIRGKDDCYRADGMEAGMSFRWLVSKLDNTDQIVQKETLVEDDIIRATLYEALVDEGDNSLWCGVLGDQDPETATCLMWFHKHDKARQWAEAVCKCK